MPLARDTSRRRCLKNVSAFEHGEFVLLDNGLFELRVRADAQELHGAIESRSVMMEKSCSAELAADRGLNLLPFHTAIQLQHSRHSGTAEGAFEPLADE